jgi:hypothetical protein
MSTACTEPDLFFEVSDGLSGLLRCLCNLFANERFKGLMAVEWALAGAFPVFLLGVLDPIFLVFTEN